MRLLLDHNVPVPLRRLLTGHEVVAAGELGWGALANGELLAAAEAAGFNVLITADKNLRYQQNLATRTIGLLVLPTQNMRQLVEGAESLIAAVGAVGQGKYLEFELKRPPPTPRPPTVTDP